MGVAPADPERAKHWQPEIQRIEWLSGVPGAAGSTCRHHLLLPNGRQVSADETFLRRDPDGTEESVGLTNGIEFRMLARALRTEQGQVSWVVEHNLRMQPIRATVAFFLGPVIRRQPQAPLNRLATWAEATYKATSGA